MADASAATSAIATATCPPGNQLPEVTTLPIPLNVSVAVIPGSNVSDSVMVACCSPNPVNIADGCYEWCEAPKAYNSLDKFSNCLVANHRNLNQSDILGFHAGSAAPGRLAPPTTTMAVTVVGLGVWMLFLSGAAGAVFSV
ncbi:hypothetical protein SCUCBS95973_004124 [Sporothrix curviconia]|uniref:Uncharacterized protein n=1 Tax=Sporothrix curviconia TaxID=1260050 RepID=A0ABP0BLK7_9PEZI